MSLFRGFRYFLLNDSSKYKILKDILGFRPQNMNLYEQAFTHSSVAGQSEHESEESNERLEFLGDAVLGAIIAEYFFLKYPKKKEGELTKMRSKLVSRSFLNQLAIDMGLDTFLETSADTRRSKSIFGDAFEALIGAIYLDRGYSTCKKFVIEKVIKDYVELSEVLKKTEDFKSKLVEYTQRERLSFHFEHEQISRAGGLYHTAKLVLNNKEVASASAASKKQAEQLAAKNFFEKSK